MPEDTAVKGTICSVICCVVGGLDQIMAEKGSFSGVFLSGDAFFRYSYSSRTYSLAMERGAIRQLDSIGN